MVRTSFVITETRDFDTVSGDPNEMCNWLDSECDFERKSAWEKCR